MNKKFIAGLLSAVMMFTLVVPVNAGVADKDILADYNETVIEETTETLKDDSDIIITEESNELILNEEKEDSIKLLKSNEEDIIKSSSDYVSLEAGANEEVVELTGCIIKEEDLNGVTAYGFDTQGVKYSTFVADGATYVKVSGHEDSFSSNLVIPKKVKFSTFETEYEVTSVGSEAFRTCSTLESVSMPSVTSVGNSAFYNCSSLQIVRMPSVTLVGAEAFKGCSNLESVLIGGQISTIFEDAFCGVGTSENPVKLVIKSSIQPDYDKEYNCYPLAGGYFTLTYAADKVPTTNGSFTLYADNAELDQDGNRNSISKDSVVKITPTPNSRYEVGEISVKDNTGTAYTVTKDGDDYTFTMPSKNVTVSVTFNEKKETDNGLQFDFIDSSDKSKGLKITGYTGTATDVVVPATATYNGVEYAIKEIYGYSYYNSTWGGAFYYNSSITSVTLPDSVEKVDEFAFRGCEKLVSVSMPNVITIGESAFSLCESLTNVSMPNVTTIGKGAFALCTNLLSVDIPKATTLAEQAFYECNKLESVSMPNVINIGVRTFYYCYELESISMPNVTTIGKFAFFICENLKNVSMPNVTSIDANAFYKCTGLKNVLIGDKLSSLYDGECPAFESVGTSTKPVKLVNKSNIAGPTSSSDKWYGGYFTLTYAADKVPTTNGSFSLSANNAEPDRDGNLNFISKDSVVKITPTPASGYEVGDISVKDNADNKYTVTQDGDDYIFTMPEKNVSVNVVFKRIKLELSANDFTFIAPGNRLPGQARNASVTCKKADAGTITVYYSEDKTNWTTEAPSAPGEYYVAVDITGTDSYVPGIKITDEAWTIKLYYEIKFDSNGGTGNMDTVSLLSTNYVLPSCAFGAPFGYHFAGWSVNKTDIVSSPYTVNNDTTLYAVWAGNEHTVSFNTDGGVINGSTTKTVTYGKTYGELPTVTKDNYVFIGWFTEADGGTEITPEAIYNKDEDITLYAHYRSAERKMTVDDITETFEYTGKAITPEPLVYYGDDKLIKGTDYTVKYVNNVNAGSKDAKDANGNSIAPTVIVTGKGNFSDTIQKSFTITKRNISNATSDDLITKANGKEQKLKPVVKYNDLKLTLNNDYTLNYSGDCINAGDYTITITGINNYEGSKTVKLTIAGEDKVLASKLSVSYPKSFEYKADTVQKPSNSDIVVKDGSKKLTEGTDYSIKWNDDDDYIEAGTHTFDIVGKDKYVGKKTCSYTIKGVKISSVKMDAIKVTYTGSELKPEVKLTRMVNGQTVVLTKGVDYIIDPENGYTNNINKGTAKVTIEGKGLYSGKLTKTFKIEAASVKDVGIEVAPFAVYEKTGAKPNVRVTYNGVILTEGTDYKLSYKDNKKITTTKNAKVTIKGLKNYKDSIDKEFTVTGADISSSLILVNDLIAGNDNTVKLGTPTLTILEKGTGKKLTASDYDKTKITYTKNDTAIDKNTVLNVGDTVVITVPGKGNYTGNISTSIKVITKENSISKAKATVADKSFTGDEITLTPSDITLKMNAKDETAISTGSYEIVADSYFNNIKKGKATVYIRGINDKGGLLKVTFKIKAQ